MLLKGAFSMTRVLARAVSRGAGSARGAAPRHFSSRRASLSPGAHLSRRNLRRLHTAALSPASAGDGAPNDAHLDVKDNLDELLELLPEDIRAPLRSHPRRGALLEVVLDLGRRPEARFLGSRGGDYLREEEVTAEELRAAEAAVGAFGSDNRAGMAGTLHRISAIRNRRGGLIGLTCRVGRAVSGHTDMVADLVAGGNSVLFLGRPGVGKTTVIREMARVLSDEMRRRVVIVDTSNEIGGDGDVPHPAIGGARRMQVPDATRQHEVMIEAVENHMPQVVIVDEIGTEAEALACRTIAERGVQLVGTAHGRFLENLIKNPTLSDLVGGVSSVTLGDEEATRRGTQKSILERRGPPTFPIVVEIRERSFWVAHWTEDSVDSVLNGKVPQVQVRMRSPGTGDVVTTDMKYDRVDAEQNWMLTQQKEAAAAAAAAGGAAAASDAGGVECKSGSAAPLSSAAASLDGSESETELSEVASVAESFDWPGPQQPQQQKKGAGGVFANNIVPAAAGARPTGFLKTRVPVASSAGAAPGKGSPQQSAPAGKKQQSAASTSKAAAKRR